MVVCGPSGSGKSTLIRCINRLESIQSGEIIVDGQSLSDPKFDPAKLRTHVGMVFQSFNLYPHMTVLQNITLAPTKVKGLAPRKLEKVAKELLGPCGDPGQSRSLSGESLGRAAATGGHCSCPGDEAEDHAF